MKKANKWFLCEENQTLDLKTHSVRRSLSFMLRSARLLCFVSVATISHERSEKVDFKAEPATWCQSPEEIPETFDFLKLSKKALLLLLLLPPQVIHICAVLRKRSKQNCAFRWERFEHRVADSVFQERFTRTLKQTELMTRLLCKSSYLTISKCHGGASVTNY